MAEASFQERFWSKAAVAGPWDCWLWKRALDVDGYGVHTHRLASGTPYAHRAHRIAFELTRGREIKPGMCVMHMCDNPGCVNPAHLVEGTVQDNNLDRDRKNRQARGEAVKVPYERHGSVTCPESRPKGEAHHRARLTDEQVREIRREWVGKWGQISQLARKYGVAYNTIRSILTGVNWKHIAAEETETVVRQR